MVFLPMRLGVVLRALLLGALGVDALRLQRCHVHDGSREHAVAQPLRQAELGDHLEETGSVGALLPLKKKQTSLKSESIYSKR